MTIMTPNIMLLCLLILQGLQQPAVPPWQGAVMSVWVFTCRVVAVCLSTVAASVDLTRMLKIDCLGHKGQDLPPTVLAHHELESSSMTFMINDWLLKLLISILDIVDVQG